MSHGTTTLPEAIDQLAASCPNKTWIRFAASSEALARRSLVDVSFRSLANAINRMSWYLYDHIPKAGDLETTLCYLGPSDIRYFIITCAATKARVKILLSSPRNDLKSHQALFEQTGCRILMGPEESCRSIREALDMEHVGVPTLEKMLDETEVDRYPWTRTLADVAREPFVILHTSGSTGQPKIVPVTHGLVATIDAQQDLPDVDGRCVTSSMWKDRAVYAAMPLFHSAGFNILAFSIFQGTQAVFGPSDAPPSLSTVEQMLDMNIAIAALIPPSLLSEVANEPRVLQKLSKWESVGFGGGPLPEDAAKLIWEQTKILPLLGSTETFNIPELLPQSEDELPYHYYHPSLGIRFDRVSEDLCELVFVRDLAQAKHQGAFCTFPNRDRYSMKDCYTRHPTKPGLWKFRGRTDDVVLLSNGEKFNPCGAEQIVSQHPEVASALIVGSGQTQPLLVIEPKAKEIPTEKLRTSEEVRRANATLPAFAQIDPTHVLITEPASFLRSGKGEVRRKPTLDALDAQIADTYASAEHAVSTGASIDLSSEEELASSLLDIIKTQILRDRVEELAEHDDLFQYGMDSQGVLRLMRLINSSIRTQGVSIDQVTPRTIYTQRTVTKIAACLNGADQTIETETGSEDSQESMQKMLDTALANLPAGFNNSLQPVSDQPTFLLTGSTGSLGTYLLDALLRRYSSAIVICFNRPGGDLSKQIKLQRQSGLSVELDRVTFVQGDTSKLHLGLDKETYQSLRTVTHVIHNAWPVNFNLRLAAFQDQLQACSNLVQLACDSNFSTSITFLSSIGAANHWTHAGYDGHVQETEMHDLNVAEKTGYSQSKLLAEHLFAAASMRCQIPIQICRVGQIAGPVRLEKGCWNTQEWFPSMLLSSKTVGVLPESLAGMDLVDWIPVDLLADVLMDVQDSMSAQREHIGYKSWSDNISMVSGQRHCAASEPSRSSSSSSASSVADGRADSTGSTTATTPDGASLAKYLHFVNPNTIGWSELAPSVKELLGDRVQLVPYDQWVSQLAASAEKDAQDVPAAKLIDFFRDVADGNVQRPVFSTKESQTLSKELRELKPVSVEWLSRWLLQWSIPLAKT